MYVLIACEESQRVCTEFRNIGHEAYSCDIQETSGDHPEWHILNDCLEIINGYCNFYTQDGKQHYINNKWDLIIAHPPCTYLTNSQNKYYNVNVYGNKALERIRKRSDAIDFFMKLVNADCDKIAIENPVGIMSSLYRKPDCIYNPYDFEGETERKRTCLWLKNLPPLMPTQHINKSDITRNMWKGIIDGKQYSWNSYIVSKYRSKTPFGVAKAMADQWG